MLVELATAGCLFCWVYLLIAVVGRFEDKFSWSCCSEFKFYCWRFCWSCMLHSWLLSCWMSEQSWVKHTSRRPSTIACTEFSNLAEGKTFVLAFLRHKAGLTHTLDGRHTQGANVQGFCRTMYGISNSFCLTCMHHGMKSWCSRHGVKVCLVLLVLLARIGVWASGRFP